MNWFIIQISSTLHCVSCICNLQMSPSDVFKINWFSLKNSQTLTTANFYCFGRMKKLLYLYNLIFKSLGIPKWIIWYRENPFIFNLKKVLQPFCFQFCDICCWFWLAGIYKKHGDRSSVSHYHIFKWVFRSLKICSERLT